MVSQAHSVAKRYAILGTGAIGGYYGACLQRAGQDVHFLLHRDYDHIQKNGLRVESVQGDFILSNVQSYAQVQEMPTADVVLIALKTTQNAKLLPALLPPLLKPETIVVTLQNGLDIEAAISDLAPHVPILGGLCFICSNKIGPGHIRHLDYGSITLGCYDVNRYPAGILPILETVAEDFRTAGIEIDLTNDLYLSRWRKLVWNIPFNGLSVVLDATTTAMMASPDSRQLAADLMGEVVEAANGCIQKLTPDIDRTLPKSIIEKMLIHTDKMKPYRTSMKIDFDEGRPLELEAILGNPLASARWAGIETPRIDMLYRQLKTLEQQNISSEPHKEGAHREHPTFAKP
ncbi:MAG: putative 2-dehydropantoate 2-reductase [Leptolyngbya sp. SIO1D8]|nr:putative 2-dehydropantoate 2-reductase [Leptolyngbya sp. SIO1D8]